MTGRDKAYQRHSAAAKAADLPVVDLRDTIKAATAIRKLMIDRAELLEALTGELSRANSFSALHNLLLNLELPSEHVHPSIRRIQEVCLTVREELKTHACQMNDPRGVAHAAIAKAKGSFA